WPVATRVAVTLALGTDAPVASVTIPAMVEVLTCAESAAARKNTAAMEWLGRIRNASRNMDPLPNCCFDVTDCWLGSISPQASLWQSSGATVTTAPDIRPLTQRPPTASPDAAH